jgi:hypothetical protein
MATVFRTCAMFDESLKKHSGAVLKVFEDFTKTKSANAMVPFGSKDRPFIGTGPFGGIKPRVIHAGMTRDISLLYSVSGQNPHVINLYGFFTHEESGTGTPAKTSTQRALAQRISSQLMK